MQGKKKKRLSRTTMARTSPSAEQMCLRLSLPDCLTDGKTEAWRGPEALPGGPTRKGESRRLSDPKDSPTPCLPSQEIDPCCPLAPGPEGLPSQRGLLGPAPESQVSSWPAGPRPRRLTAGSNPSLPVPGEMAQAWTLTFCVPRVTRPGTQDSRCCGDRRRQYKKRSGLSLATSGPQPSVAPCASSPPPLGLFSATTKLTLHRNLWLLREREGGSRSCTQEPTPGPGWGVAGVQLMRQRDVQ